MTLNSKGEHCKFCLFFIWRMKPNTRTNKSLSSFIRRSLIRIYSVSRMRHLTWEQAARGANFIVYTEYTLLNISISISPFLNTSVSAGPSLLAFTQLLSVLQCARGIRPAPKPKKRTRLENKTQIEHAEKNSLKWCQRCTWRSFFTWLCMCSGSSWRRKHKGSDLRTHCFAVEPTPQKSHVCDGEKVVSVTCLTDRWLAKKALQPLQRHLTVSWLRLVWSLTRCCTRCSSMPKIREQLCHWSEVTNTLSMLQH